MHAERDSDAARSGPEISAQDDILARADGVFASDVAALANEFDVRREGLDGAAQRRTGDAEDRAEAAERARDLERELATLKDAIASRTVIGQAQGLLMSQYRVDPDGAFALLVRLSQQTHTKLRDVAARIVQAAIDDHTD